LEIAHFASEELRNNLEDQQRIVSIDIHQGHPVADILEAADKIDADLIVIGSHGKGHLHYAFLGSVAEKLLRKSFRPILTVPVGPKKGA
jgi:nucleotide-binding universal stress UspA family protein